MKSAQEQSLLLATVLTTAAALLDGYLATRTGLRVLTALLPLLVLAATASLLNLLRLRLHRAAEEERLAQEAARHEAETEATLFGDVENSAPMSQARSRDQFERFVVPFVAAPAAILGFGSWAWRLVQHLRAGLTVVAEPLLAAAFLAGQAFLLFLLGRYVIGLARGRGLRLCRGPGIYLVLGGLGSVLAAATGLGTAAIGEQIDLGAAWVLTALLVLLTVEWLVLLVTGFYHPRRRTMLALTLESRLGGLCSDPAGWVAKVSQALVYQTGHNAADNLGQLLHRAVVPILGLVALLVWLLSGVVVLGPHEQGLRERFGRVQEGEVLDSGLHLTLPWPFERVRRVPSKRVVIRTIGYEPPPFAERPKVLLWTEAHYAQEDLIALPSAQQNEGETPITLLSVHLPVEYRIIDPYAYVYGHQDAAAMFDQVARQSLTRVMAGFDHAALRQELQVDQTTQEAGELELFTMGRRWLSEQMRAEIQAEAERLQLGVEVVFVGVQDVHPPLAVAKDYQAVVGAQQESRAQVLQAEAEALRTVPLSRAEAREIELEGATYQAERRSQAEAEALRFAQQTQGYQAAPEVFLLRHQLEAMHHGLGNARKYLVDASTAREVITLNLEEELALPFMSFGSEGANHEKN